MKIRIYSFLPLRLFYQSYFYSQPQIRKSVANSCFISKFFWMMTFASWGTYIFPNFPPSTSILLQIVNVVFLYECRQFSIFILWQPKQIQISAQVCTQPKSSKSRLLRNSAKITSHFKRVVRHKQWITQPLPTTSVWSIQNLYHRICSQILILKLFQTQRRSGACRGRFWQSWPGLGWPQWSFTKNAT